MNQKKKKRKKKNGPKSISAVLQMGGDGIKEEIIEGGFSRFETLFHCQTVIVNQGRTDIFHNGECHASVRSSFFFFFFD